MDNFYGLRYVHVPVRANVNVEIVGGLDSFRLGSGCLFLGFRLRSGLLAHLV